MDEQDDNALNHLRAWREKARLTQEQLGAKLDPPTTGAVISLLESGDRQLSPKWLRKIAPVLGTTPGHLLDHHPDDVSNTVVNAALNVAPEHRAQVIDILRTFERKTGAAGG